MDSLPVEHRSAIDRPTDQGKGARDGDGAVMSDEQEPSPSRRKIGGVERLAQARGALGKASSTGWMSVGELPMTRRISLVAVCCSSASVTWAWACVSASFCSCSSVSRRAFSIAMTA